MDKKTIITIISTVAVCALGLFGYDYFKNNHKDREPIKPEFEQTQTKEEVEKGVTPGIAIPGYSEININAGEKKAKVDFYNPEKNEVYFKIKLMINDTKEVIFESKLFEPGQHLYEIELQKAMTKGVYDMTIVYETYAMDEEYTPRNGANVNCILRVN